jgi:UDP-N-acetylmuramoyl-L-alanyl-D-glutamate--2,6-diaminopimelate ligase
MVQEGLRWCAMEVSSHALAQGRVDGLESVPGRLERVPNDNGLTILIDYAHTADAIRLVLLSLREVSRGRVIVVFGCGGDRDQTKRPVMGRMAALLADYVVVTSDNPRSEHPCDIMRQITAGFPPGFRQFDVVEDREQAMTTALSMARPGDTVLIAGKGHEAYQMFDHICVPFSDREVVERWMSHKVTPMGHPCTEQASPVPMHAG